MFWFDFLAALVVAIVLSLLLVGVFGRRYPTTDAAAWPGALFFFFIIFLFAWVGGVWWHPVGLEFVWITHWVPFFLVALFVALLIAALVPGPRVPPEDRVRTPDEPVQGDGAGLVIGVFFWILIIALVITLIVAYV